MSMYSSCTPRRHVAHVISAMTALVLFATTLSVLLAAPAWAASTTPAISAISPTTGPLGGGTKVTITGARFTRSSVVTFGSTRATKVTYSSTTKLYAYAPPVNAATSVAVRVKTSKGTSGSKTFSYRTPPAISSITPATGTTQGGATVTVRGNNFLKDTTRITFGGITSPKVTYVSSTQLAVTTPKADAAGRVDVVATNKYGIGPAAAYEYTTPAPTTRLAVGSFNVRVASASESSQNSYEQKWTTRLPVVAHQIRRADLDVLGIQEASASTKYTRGGVAQFADILAELGSPYAFTNTDRYCKAPDEAGRCPTGASSSDRILYNTNRLQMQNNGSRKLDTRAWDNGSGRYVVWAEFEAISSGKKFFFVNTHLEPGTEGATRQQQVAIILEEIAVQNTNNLPVVVVGDLGSTKFDSQVVSGHTNIAHRSFIDGGFTDPLVNTPKYKGVPTFDAINVKYSSLNYFNAAPQLVAGAYPIGSYIDYIMTRGGVFTYQQWETVLDLDGDGNFAGVIPSDHNLITLDLTLQ